MLWKSLSIGALLVLTASTASAEVVNLRCALDNGGGTLSVKVDYDASRVTEIMEYMDPDKPRGGPGAAADGSVPARITDALVLWTVTQTGEWYEKYQLDRYTGILRMDLHIIQNQFHSYYFHCQAVQPSQRKF